jgi:citrate lyase gamma subunit
MVHLNFTDLSEEAQNRLLELSKKDVERKFGNEIRKYVRENYSSFEKTIEEEALRNLYFY